LVECDADRGGHARGEHLGCASPSIVKMLENGYGDTYPDLPWKPKAAFMALADYYRG